MDSKERYVKYIITKMRTFDELCAVEPRLRRLFAAVPRIMPREGGDYFDWHAWERIKSQMSQLVGWFSNNLELGSPDDYHTAYMALLAEAERVSDLPAVEPAEELRTIREGAAKCR